MKNEKSEITLFIREKNVDDFWLKFCDWRTVQKYVHLVDLVKSFPTNIFLQKLASIQKRTSPIKFARKYSLESSWRDQILQDLHAFAPLRPQYFRKLSSNFFAFFWQIFAKFVIFEFFSLILVQILMNFVGISPMFYKMLKFSEIFEFSSENSWILKEF